MSTFKEHRETARQHRGAALHRASGGRTGDERAKAIIAEEERLLAGRDHRAQSLKAVRGGSPVEGSPAKRARGGPVRRAEGGNADASNAAIRRDQAEADRRFAVHSDADAIGEGMTRAFLDRLDRLPQRTPKADNNSDAYDTLKRGGAAKRARGGAAKGKHTTVNVIMAGGGQPQGGPPVMPHPPMPAGAPVMPPHPPMAGPPVAGMGPPPGAMPPGGPMMPHRRGGRAR